MERKITEKIISFAKTKVSNYHPCVKHGFTKAIDFHESEWDGIGWDIFHDIGNEIPMICVFNNDSSIKGRASFILNTETGEVSNFSFESLEKFNVDDAFDFVSADKFYKKSEKALLSVKSLIEYFCQINALEREKASLAARFDDIYGEKNTLKTIKPSKNTTYVNKPYHPNRERGSSGKSVVVNKECERNYITPSWQRIGHYRRLRNGKMAYIKPQTVHRKSLINR